MFSKNKLHEKSQLTTETSELAREASGNQSTAGWLTGLVSALALIFSGISLYETVLKQAEIHLFVPNTVAYTRDPNGGFEVFVIPVTVTNSGARDGLVSSLKLTVQNTGTGQTRVFHSNFIAGDAYLSTKEDFTKGLTRPKKPFTPIAIPGRSSRSETLLFYARKPSPERVLTKEGTFNLMLSAKTDGMEQLSFLDKLSANDIDSLQFTAELPKVSRYFDGQINTGYSARMFVKD